MLKHKPHIPLDIIMSSTTPLGKYAFEQLFSLLPVHTIL
jgi:hypothetical protein